MPLYPKKWNNDRNLRVEGRSQNYRKIEEEILNNIELRDKILAMADELMPVLKGKCNSLDVVKLLNQFSPVAVIRLIDTVVNGKSERVRAQAAKDLLYMAGFKPVEKSVNFHDTIDRMSPEQLDAYLSNTFKEMCEEEKEKLIRVIKSE